LPPSEPTDITYDAFAFGSYPSSTGLIGRPPSVDSAISLNSAEEPLFAAFFATPGLSEHQYIRLSQYSLLRALVLNSNILALDPSILADDDALSPWTLANPYLSITPTDLAPTSIQLCTPHHPYLDILTPPKFRDNILLTLMGDKLEDQLCYELHLGAFMIWGSQPWNALGMCLCLLYLLTSAKSLYRLCVAWEVTQTFATNWAWLMDDDLIRSSNFWRGERGEPPLVTPDLGGGILGEVF